MSYPRPIFFKVPYDADLSTVCVRAAAQYQDEPYLYIEYYEGIVPRGWIEMSKEDIITLFGYDPFEDKPEPIPETLSETDQAILDTAINMEYLLALQELGLLIE